MKLSPLLFVNAILATFFYTAVSFTFQNSFAVHRQLSCNDAIKRRVLLLQMSKVGVFFGTSTGSTEEAAYAILEALGSDLTDLSDPIDIDSLQGKLTETFQQYDSLVVGTPTWNTGADTERSGTGWDELYYAEMQDLKIQGKKVAVFGLGDSVSYGENYADASGELYDVFESLGCNLYGQTSQEGYLHEASKAIRGDRFCGLLLDAVNQEDLTEERVKRWVKQLIGEGFTESTDDASSSSTIAIDATIIDISPTAETELTPRAKIVMESPLRTLEQLEKENARLRQMLEENSLLLEESIKTSGTGHASKEGVGVNAPVVSAGVNGYIPHYNSKTGRTMWISADGKSCYYTSIDSSLNP